MPYEQKVGTHNPGLILILLDQSFSMRDAFPDGKRKADAAARAVNRLIYEIQERCQAGETIKDRCTLGVIGYGPRVLPLASGTISELSATPLRIERVREERINYEGVPVEVEMEMPVWVEPEFENGTPMAEAMRVAADVIRDQWLPMFPDSFPPIVINITDGEPNSIDTARAEAQALRGLSTSDGNVLLFNAHISHTATGEILLPSSPHGLPDRNAAFLFDVSSPIPDEMMSEARKAGFQPQPGSRGLVLNAGAATLVRLINFGSSVV